MDRLGWRRRRRGLGWDGDGVESLMSEMRACDGDGRRGQGWSRTATVMSEGDELECDE